MRYGDWILRFVKGIFIGSGFILPGISGGALAAVFGVYERMIAFLADLRRDFMGNVRFFLPVVLGMGLGIFLLSFALSFLLGEYEHIMMWFFIGCIVGTLPSMIGHASKKGVKPGHLAFMAVTCVAFSVLLFNIQWASDAAQAAGASAAPQSGGLDALKWLGSGGLIGLGAILPGLSPSNLLESMGLLLPMSDGIKHLNPIVIVPLIVGAAAVVLLLSKLMKALFERAYAAINFFILGVVAASTIVIVPLRADYLSINLLWFALALAAGAALALWMERLGDKYKPEE
ncbi:MAG: DUF368 domain-containing protein [Clostridiales bacterium]|nr:DUF368 domain-containing protein [Clostridiales bacterium]